MWKSLLSFRCGDKTTFNCDDKWMKIEISTSQLFTSININGSISDWMWLTIYLTVVISLIRLSSTRVSIQFSPSQEIETELFQQPGWEFLKFTQGSSSWLNRNFLDWRKVRIALEKNDKPLITYLYNLIETTTTEGFI